MINNANKERMSNKTYEGKSYWEYDFFSLENCNLPIANDQTFFCYFVGPLEIINIQWVIVIS